VTRSHPPLRLARSPLALALVEVRIGTILKMPDFVPAIQDRLRRDGYPGYSESQVQQVLIAGGGPLMGPPQVQSSVRWVFLNEQNVTAAVLSSSAIVLETASYETFDDFVDKLTRILDVVREEAGVSRFERLGLRYVDIVRPIDGDVLADYIAPGVLGIDESSFGGTDPVSRCEVRASTPRGTLVARVTRGFGEVPFPPDLVPLDVISPLLEAANSAVAVLDFDHFSAEPGPFDDAAVVNGLWGLHDNIDRAFRAAVTDHAMKRWEAEPA
jgi:uncharacterized protein (TIGR04255 family)